jgi:hypothetical protein
MAEVADQVDGSQSQKGMKLDVEMGAMLIPSLTTTCI